MAWSLSKADDLNEIIPFLLKDEWLHIQALSLFHNTVQYFYPKKHNVLSLVKKVNGVIESMIIINKKGLIYPIFNNDPFETIEEKDELTKILVSINVRIHGVIGLESHVDILDEILFKSIRGVNNYLILHRSDEKIFTLQKELVIKKAQNKDLNRLIPLEYEYQKEEVLLNPLDLNTRVVKENFKNKLKSDDIYFIEGKNIPISKAGTTFKSPNYTLIGGVFTWKEERNNGYGTELLKYLLNDQLSKGLKSALFVKSDNQSAIHLYGKLGFTDSKPYKINYYYN